MDSKSAVRVRVGDEVVAQCFSQKDLCPLCLCGLVTKPLFSHRVPGTSTEFVLCWVPFPVEGKREAVAGGEHHTRSVKCINLPLRALIMIQVNCCAKGFELMQKPGKIWLLSGSGMMMGAQMDLESAQGFQ